LQLATLTQQQNFNLRAIVLNRMLDERTFEALRSVRKRPPAYLTSVRAIGSTAEQAGADASGTRDAAHRR